jgi:hypothetical protein
VLYIQIYIIFTESDHNIYFWDNCYTTCNIYSFFMLGVIFLWYGMEYHAEGYLVHVAVGTLLYQFKSLKRLGQPLHIYFRVPPPWWGRLLCRHVAPGAWWLHCSASYCWGGLLCCDVALDPLWPLGVTSPLKRAPVPLHGSGLVVAPWICLPAKARFHAATWLRAHGAAPWLCLPTEVDS